MNHGQRDREYPLDITWGLYGTARGTPFDKLPQPRHNSNRHWGWVEWCPLCCELREYVYRILNMVPDVKCQFNGEPKGRRSKYSTKNEEACADDYQTSTDY